GVGEDGIALRVEGHGVRVLKQSVGGGRAVGAESQVAGSGDGGDLAIRCDLADTLVADVGEVDVALWVDGYVADTGLIGSGQECVDCGAAIAEEGPSAGDRVYGSIRVHASDAATEAVGEIHVAGRVESDAEDRAELGGRRGSAIARKSRLAGTGHVAENSLR